MLNIIDRSLPQQLLEADMLTLINCNMFFTKVVVYSFHPATNHILHQRETGAARLTETVCN